MPIFEYRCRSCGAEFEQLVRTTDVPACSACNSKELEQQLTSFAVSSAERSQRALSRARDVYRQSKTAGEADTPHMSSAYARCWITCAAVEAAGGEVRSVKCFEV